MLEEYSYESMFGTAEVFSIETDEGVPLRCLYVGGGFQSATFLGEDRFVAPFAYCRAFDVMFEADPAPRNVLLLGGGAFSYPKHVLSGREDVRMDVVEIDPVIIDIARRHFFVDELEDQYGERLRSFAEDGLEFLQRAEAGSYDAIVNDSFAGTVQDAPLLAPEGLRLTKNALAPNGLYLLNAVFDELEGLELQRALNDVETALASTFAHVRYDAIDDEEYAGCTNYVFVASDGALPTR